jgi:biotin synthase
VSSSEAVQGREALKTIAALQLAMPCTVLRYAGGRELTLGDLGAREGILGGINAIIVGNYPDDPSAAPHSSTLTCSTS